MPRQGEIEARRCSNCNRPIHDPESIRIGMGSTCRAKIFGTIHRLRATNPGVNQMAFTFDAGLHEYQRVSTQRITAIIRARFQWNRGTGKNTGEDDAGLFEEDIPPADLAQETGPEAL
jgi:hypothetical protein